MTRTNKRWLVWRQSAVISAALKPGVLSLAMVCALAAGDQAEKQSEFAPNLIGNATATPHGSLVRFAGIPDFSYTIQSSVDGTNWTAVSAVVAPADGLIEFIDTNSAAVPRFYRTATP